MSRPKYCPNCESGDVYEASNGLMHCKMCGETFEAEDDSDEP